MAEPRQPAQPARRKSCRRRSVCPSKKKGAPAAESLDATQLSACERARGARFSAAVARLGRLGVRLLFHTDLISQLNELLQIPPLLFAHQPSVRTRKINRYESFGGERRTDDQLRLLVFRQWLGHVRFLQMDADSITNSSIRSLNVALIKNAEAEALRQAEARERHSPDWRSARRHSGEWRSRASPRGDFSPIPIRWAHSKSVLSLRFVSVIESREKRELKPS
jgi:hypothetical protein